MTTSNVIDRTPSKFDYASPIQFRFKCGKLPQVEFTCQTANVPGISLGEATMATPLKDIPIPGERMPQPDEEETPQLERRSFMEEALPNDQEQPRHLQKAEPASNKTPCSIWESIRTH